MTKKRDLLYEEAIEELESYGITGAQIYLIDLIPLIEMIWADGKAQGAEISLLADFLKKHVEHINALAGLCQPLANSGRAYLLVHVFLKLRTEMLEDGNYRVTGRPGKVAVGGILHGPANQIQSLQILRFTISLNDALQDFAQL